MNGTYIDKRDTHNLQFMRVNVLNLAFRYGTQAVASFSENVVQ
jgi:hypothetical protein